MMSKLRAYSGWNTGSNTVGFALNQGILAAYMKEEEKNKLIVVRMLDDWAYQANVRREVLAEKVYPLGISAVRLGDSPERN